MLGVLVAPKGGGKRRCGRGPSRALAFPWRLCAWFGPVRVLGRNWLVEAQRRKGAKVESKAEPIEPTARATRLSLRSGGRASQGFLGSSLPRKAAASARAAAGLREAWR